MQKGRKMKLRRLEMKDAEGMLEWMNDVSMQPFFRFTLGNKTIEEAQEFIAASQQKVENGGTLHYAICNETDEYLGTISLKDIDFISKHAEYAISIRKKAQGQGLGYQSTREILRIAFEELQLNKVYLNVLSDNKRAIKLYEKSGFIYEGEAREHLYLRGCFRSLKWYSILAEEYYRINKKEL